MTIKSSELRAGSVLMFDGQLHLVLETEHVKPGKGPAYVQAKMKNIETGTIKTNRLGSADKLDDVSIDRKSMQYLYDGSGRGAGPFVFMDTGSYEQIEIPAEAIGDQARWMKEGVEAMVMMFGGRILGVELPAAVELAVTETTPQPRGATATNQLKEATVETGARIRVPPFIDVGQVVRISTVTGEYLGKA
jgi:elongation factor P